MEVTGDRVFHTGSRQARRPAVFSALSPIKHSPPAQVATPSPASPPFAAIAKDRSAAPAPADAGKHQTRAVRKPLGPRSPAGTPPSTLRGYASKENARARAGTPEKEYVKDNRKEKRHSQILRDVTRSENVSGSIGSSSSRKAAVAKTAGKDVEQTPAGANKSADTSKDSVRSRMMEWERERERLREMERRSERVREADEEHEHEREAEERASEPEPEPRKLQAEVGERQGVDLDEGVRLDRVRERRRDKEAQRQGSEAEYVLPKISVGPSLTPALTPPSTGLSTPLSPLLEGTSHWVDNFIGCSFHVQNRPPSSSLLRATSLASTS